MKKAGISSHLIPGSKMVFKKEPVTKETDMTPLFIFILSHHVIIGKIFVAIGEFLIGL